MNNKNIRTIALYSAKKTTKDGKRNWIEFYTKMSILVKGEEEKGFQEKSITIKFAKDINTKDFKRGYVYVDVANLIAPSIYQIKVDADGKKDYPFIYIKKIEKFVATTYQAPQNAFATSDEIPLPFDDEN